MISTMKLPDLITYWVKLPNDGHGNPAFAAPVLAASRNANSSKKVMDHKGNETIARAVCYTKDVIPPESFVAFGDQTAEPIPTSESLISIALVLNRTMTDMKATYLVSENVHNG